MRCGRSELMRLQERLVVDEEQKETAGKRDLEVEVEVEE